MNKVNLLTPFTQVTRRSAPIGASVNLLTGRWAGIDASGNAILPTANKGAYLILEGNYETGVNNASFGGSTPFWPATAIALPSNAPGAGNQAGLAYGPFRFEVGPEGFDGGSPPANGTRLKVDADGRLIPVTASTDICVAVAEGDATSTRLVARATGAA